MLAPRSDPSRPAPSRPTPPRPEQEFGRLLALAAYEVLDTAPEISFDRVTRLAAQMLDLPVVALNLVDHDRVWCKSAVGVEPGETPRSDAPCAWTILSDEVNAVPDLHADARFCALPMVEQYPELHSYVGAPLITPGGLRVGTLCGFDPRRRHFGEQEQEVLRSFAGIVVNELELRSRNLALEREIDHHAQQIERLNRLNSHAGALAEVSELLAQDISPEDALMRVGEVLGQAADVDWVGLITSQVGVLHNATAWARPGLQPAFLNEMARLGEYRQGVTWQVLRGREAAFIDNYADSPRAQSAFVQAGMRAAAWLPVGEYDGVQHLLLISRNDRPDPWRDSDRALFQAAARIVARSLEHRAYLDHVEAAAFRDALTGLGNRRAFDQALEVLDTSQQGFTVAILDLDGLKAVNDLEGHSRGDLLLTLFARALRGEFRATDGVYRLGGDEFAVLLPQATELEEADVFERVDVAVVVMRSASFSAVGASLGVATRHGGGPSAQEVAQQADARMYEMKRRRKRAA